METTEIRELSENEIEMVSGGLDAETAGLAIIALGVSGGVATAAFGLPIGFALLYLASQ